MMREKRELPPKSERIIEPFRIFGNVYFIGTYAESSHIIDTGEGLIMIDTGRDNLTAILKGLEAFGFAPEDVKYIINSHWHGDHTASTAKMVELSGAKTLIGKEDHEKAKKFFDADILVSEGDTLKLGNRRKNSRTPHLHGNCANNRLRALGSILIGACPARRMRRCAKRPIESALVYLDYGAVNLKRKIVPPHTKLVNCRDGAFHISRNSAEWRNLKAPTLKCGNHLSVR